MTDHKKFASFKNHIFMIGFGSIGQGVLPLILRHLDVTPEQISIITADDRGIDIAKAYNVPFEVNPLTPDTYRQVLGSHLSEGDFVVNVSVDVSSVALMELCQEKGALYIDTVVEPWGGQYVDPGLSIINRSNYIMREAALELVAKYPNGPTAITCLGANPGMVNILIKQALLNMASDTGLSVEHKPETRQEWAELTQRLGVKTIHVAERDTQVSATPKKVDEFVNTWSIDGFYGEGNQPSELGWGTHEKELPAKGKAYTFGCGSAIYMERPGRLVQVRSWTPLEGPYHGFLITHNESISIADYLTLRNDKDEVVYRPTCHYAYHPCDAAVLSVHEMNGKNGRQPSTERLMKDEIIDGIDELGVLLMGNDKGVYWYGSRLSIQQTRALVPHNNATSLQVTAALLSGIVWALENPKRGVVEPEYMDFERVMELMLPYLGDVVGVWGDWTPLKNRSVLFPEEVDSSDPWQFKNILVG